MLASAVRMVCPGAVQIAFASRPTRRCHGTVQGALQDAGAVQGAVQGLLC